MQINSKLPIVVTIIAILLLLTSSFWIELLPCKFIKNYSVSEKPGLYVVKNSNLYKKGDLVLVTFPSAALPFVKKRAWLHEDIPLLKRIAAVKNDRICHRQGKLTINGIKTATILEKDSKGEEIKGVTGCYKIKPGEVLLINTHSPNSFDGRYFGPVSKKLVMGKASPLVFF